MLYTSTRNNYIILLYYIYIYIFISNIYYIIFIFIVLLVPERKKSWKQPFLTANQLLLENIFQISIS